MLAKTNKNLKKEGVFKMQNFQKQIGKKVLSCVIALLMVVSMLPFAAFTAFAETQGILFITDTITPDTKTVEVNIGQAVTGGFAKIIQIDGDEEYNPEKLFQYDGLSGVIGYKNITEGSNTFDLVSEPTEGMDVYAVLRDTSSGESQEYVAGPIKVTASQGGGEEEAPTTDQILKGCEVTIDGYEDSKITEDATSLTANVKLHKSVESCYMIVISYPANVEFDPDSSAVKVLYSGKVVDGGTYTCNFAKSNLPLQVGQKVSAYLNVPIGDDNYRQVRSRELVVVDENGEGFKEYVWPEVSIADTELKAGDTKLHINFSADDRLLAYAKDENVDFHMTISIQQYPKDEKFDFEGDYMRQMISPMQVSENLDNYEVTLNEPLLAGYRVRAVVYWLQNKELFIPKGNDYEAAGILDDSVLIPEEPVAPSLKINAEKIKAGATNVSVEVAGDIESGTMLIVRQYATLDDVGTDNWNFFGSTSVSEAGNVSVDKNSAAQKLEAGKYVAAVLMKGATIVATSNAVPVVSETEVDKPILTVNGNVFEGGKTVSLNVSKTDLIPSGKGMINLYVADSNGEVDVWGGAVSVGSKSPVVSGDNVEIPVTGELKAGDIIVPYIYYYDVDADRQYYYPGTAFTVKAAVEGDNFTVSPETITADTESITVSVKGYDSYKDGYVFAKLANSENTDPDSATFIGGGKKYTGSGTYTFDTKGKLTHGKYVLVYLYKYDIDTDRTNYSDKLYLPITGKVEKEPVVEITSSKILSTDNAIYVKADYDAELTGQLDIYTYSYAGEFDLANENNVLLYTGNVTPSEYGNKVSFTDALTAGNKIVAVLTLNGGESRVVKVSDSKTIQAPPQITEPSAYIREEHISEGDTKMDAYINFEKYYYDKVSYVVYNYTGDTLDESTAKIAAQGDNIYNPGQMSIGFKSEVKPLEAGSKLVIKLILVKDDKTKTVYSNVKVVEAAPDWATPTVSIDVAAVRTTDTTIPVTVTYDKGYTEMSDYYCNVTAYQFPSTYTDDDFEKNELHENTTITKRVGQCDANKEQKEYFTTISIPVKADVLEAGKRLIVKLRLPHPEWAGEEADYLSYSVPVIGADEEMPVAKVLLFNLGEDTVKGSKIRNILKEMGIEAVTVEKSEINRTVGYLAGFKGYNGDAEDFTGEGYTSEFMLMSSLSETQLDNFLAKMKETDAVIDHKAMVTDTNKEWSFKQLIGEIEEEHETMQAWNALGNVIKEAEKLKETDYKAENWAKFKEVLDQAKELYGYEASAKDYNDAAAALKEAYKELTGTSLDKVKHTVTVEGSKASNTGAGEYLAGETVTISAGKRSGYKFKGWTADGIKFEDESSADTTFVMPDENVTVTAEWKKVSSGSSSGGSSSSEKNYSVVKSDVDNGTVKVNKTSASKGSKVTITVTPDEGYKLDSLVVTDKNGNKIKLTNEGNGKYSFEMPSSKVEIKAEYVPVEESTDDEQNTSTDGFVNPFNDVNKNDWFYNAVKYAYENNIMSGIANNEFGINSSVTRGMVIAVLHRIENEPDAGLSTFTDVSSDKYYAKAIAWAKKNNIVNGYDEYTFGPDDVITREQLAAILYSYALYKGMDVNESGNLAVFVDTESISAWAKKAVEWAVGEDLISGKGNGNLAPLATASRAEAAQIFMNFLDK